MEEKPIGVCQVFEWLRVGKITVEEANQILTEEREKRIRPIKLLAKGVLGMLASFIVGLLGLLFHFNPIIILISMLICFGLHYLLEF